MSFIKTLPIALLLFSLVIVGMYVSTSSLKGGGFWANNGYTAPQNNIANFNLIANVSRSFGTDVACDINPEDANCVNKQKSLEDGDFISRLVLGVAGGITTVYKAFFLPVYLLQEVAVILNIPIIFIQVAYTILFILLVISILFLIFTRSDT